MSPRKNSGRPSAASSGGGRSGGGKYARPAPDPDEIARSFGYQHTESDATGDWVVRKVTGAAAGKTYRCPGCDHQRVPGGTLYRQVYSSGDPVTWFFGVSLARPDGSAVSAYESLAAPSQQAASAGRRVADADVAALVQDERLRFPGAG